MGAGASAGEITADSVAAKADEVLKLNADNRCVKYLLEMKNEGTLPTEAKDLARLYACAKTGLENVDSGLGCYAMDPKDYDDLALFFDKVCNDYHNNPAGTCAARRTTLGSGRCTAH